MIAAEERIIISVEEAAEFLHVSSRHVYRLIAQDQLPGVLDGLGHRRLVHLPTLKAALAQRAKKAV